MLKVCLLQYANINESLFYTLIQIITHHTIKIKQKMIIKLIIIKL